MPPKPLPMFKVNRGGAGQIPQEPSIKLPVGGTTKWPLKDRTVAYKELARYIAQVIRYIDRLETKKMETMTGTGVFKWMNQLAVLALTVAAEEDPVLAFMAKMLPDAKTPAAVLKDARAWSASTPIRDLETMAKSTGGAIGVEKTAAWDICAFILQHVKTLLAPVAPLTAMDALTLIEPQADELLKSLEAQNSQ